MNSTEYVDHNKLWKILKEMGILGGNANEYSHYGEQCGDSLKNWK